MKISDGEIRGTIILAAILLTIMGIAWILSPASCSNGRSSDTVLFPEDSTAADTPPCPTLPAGKEKATDDTTSTRPRNPRKKTARGSKARKGPQLQPDRPSPLDSPVAP